MKGRVIGLFIVLQAPLAANAQAVPTNACNSGTQPEIVVCGSRSGQNPYRIPKLPDKYGRKPVRAETDAIPGVHTLAHVESQGMPDGNVSKRLMVTFSLPF